MLSSQLSISSTESPDTIPMLKLYKNPKKKPNRKAHKEAYVYSSNNKTLKISINKRCSDKSEYFF